MKYEAVYLYNNRNEFLGVGIKKTNAPQLQSVNIWSDSDEEIEDFRKTLAGLNDEGALREHWPQAMDPEVIELVENPDWEPLELHEASVPDWENATLVYKRDSVWGYDYDGATDQVLPRPGPEGKVEWKDSEEIDYDQSTIPHKQAMVPDPKEVQDRYFKAQEIVARRRLQALFANDRPA